MTDTLKSNADAAASTTPEKSPAHGSPTGSHASAKPPDVVVFKNVSKHFGHGPEAKVALEDVCFVVEDAPNVGELVTVVGPSGCGKSTLLRILAGLKPHFPPTKGEVLVLGKEVTEAGADRGLVVQKDSLLPHLTVLAN